MTLTIKQKFHFRVAERSKRRLAPDTGTDASAPSLGVPRISRLMALAIRFAGLIRDGQVRDQAELAALGHVTRARLTQIMNLLNLAPDIQEQLLFLERPAGRDPITERTLRPLASEPDWRKQRETWAGLCRESRS